MADAPIALCEVQGYVYQGKSMLAEVARAIGDGELAGRLEQEADRLRRRFQSAFWCEDLGTYALALDGSKQRCACSRPTWATASWSGIAAPEHAQRIVETLMGPAFFSGWGIRTIAQGEPRYNPMSYHNGRSGRTTTRWRPRAWRATAAPPRR